MVTVFCLNLLFQSTLPRGSDTGYLPPVRALLISIHAPSRERPDTLKSHKYSCLFQSTLPRGSDAPLVSASCTKSYFNPRSLAGATQLRFQQIRLIFISIHAPSRERLLSVEAVTQTILFQSTLPRGSDLASFVLRHGVSISIHAPSRERHISALHQRHIIGFQSTLPRGSDLYLF